MVVDEAWIFDGFEEEVDGLLLDIAKTEVPFNRIGSLSAKFREVVLESNLGELFIHLDGRGMLNSGVGN